MLFRCSGYRLLLEQKHPLPERNGHHVDSDGDTMLARISEKHATIQKHSNTRTPDPDVIYRMTSIGYVCFSDHQKKKILHISLTPYPAETSPINYTAAHSDRIPYKSGTVVILTQTESPEQLGF